MEWLVFALLAPVLFGIGNIIDKLVLSRHIKNRFSWVVVLSSVHVTYALLLSLLVPIQFIFPYSIFAILLGMLSMLTLLLYAKAMMVEEVSRVVIFFNMSPLFIILLAAVFLGEKLTFLKYIGISLLVAGSILISYRRVKEKMSIFISALKFLLPIPVILAISAVSQKYLLNHIGYFSLFFCMALGMFLFGVSLLLSQTIRRNLVITLRKPRKISFVFVSDFVASLGIIASFIALSLGPVSLISAFGSLQPLFVLVYALFLSIFLPRILKEEIDKRTIMLKLIAVIVVLIGSYLILR